MNPGQIVGAFTCVRALRSGGMAQLFVARRTDAPHDLVVIKRVLPSLGCDPEFVRMFDKEARIGRALVHPNIARVIESGLHEGAPYMAVEYVHGVDLRRLLKRAVADKGALPLGVALGIGVAVAKALDYAHDHAGVVHRDVDPTNVLVAHDGLVKLVDFGIARTMASTHTTRASWVKGKAGYMAPEQCLGEHLDHRTDVFALGILLYEMTTGYRRFHGATDYEPTSLILAGEYVRPGDAVADYPPELEAVIVRALEREPDNRWATTQDLAAALAEFARTAEVTLDPAHRAQEVAALLQPAAVAPAPATRSQFRNVMLGAALAVPVAAAALAIARPGSASPARASTALPRTPNAAPQPAPPKRTVVSERARVPRSAPEPVATPESVQTTPAKRSVATPRRRRSARAAPKKAAAPAPAPEPAKKRQHPADTILPPSWTGHGG